MATVGDADDVEEEGAIGSICSKGRRSLGANLMVGRSSTGEGGLVRARQKLSIVAFVHVKHQR